MKKTLKQLRKDMAAEFEEVHELAIKDRRLLDKARLDIVVVMEQINELRKATIAANDRIKEEHRESFRAMDQVLSSIHVTVTNMRGTLEAHMDDVCAHQPMTVTAYGHTGEGPDVDANGDEAATEPYVADQ